jgi:ATP-dependent DNA ligase
MKKFIGNKPITFSSKTYQDNITYYLTYKLDGSRKLLFISKNSCNFIDSKSINTKYICDDPKFDELHGTLLDGELFKGILYVFDILYYKGKSVVMLSLSERIKLMEKLKDLPGIKIKQYIPTNKNNIYNVFKFLKTKYKAQLKNGEVDGIIFTPSSDYYSKVLKWKPLSLLSIDFKINKKNGMFYLLKQNGKLFIPRDQEYKDKGISKLSVSKKIYDKYKSGDVIEAIFDYKKNKFKVLRGRPDKDKSNYDTVINSNFEQIVHPESVKKILT